MRFDAQDLRHHFDAGTYQRGQDYARKGKVLAAHWENDKLIGEVDGSGAERYRQTIRVGHKSQGIAIQGSCSCPVSYNCKHVVAVLLADLAHAQASAPAAAGLSEAWLEQLAALSRKQQDDGVAPAGAISPLVWVLAPDPRGGVPRLHMRRARMRKNGDVSGTTPVHDVHALLRALPASRDAGDEELVRWYAALLAGSHFTSDAEASGVTGARLLTRLCAEGRLLLAWSIDDLGRGQLSRLRPGPGRQAGLGWRDTLDDTVRLDWLFLDSGAAAAVLPTDPPCYVDGYELGELTLPGTLARTSPAALVSLIARAPQLKPGQRADMAARLADLGLEHLVPLPQQIVTHRRSDILPTPIVLLDSMEAGWGRNATWHDHALFSFEYDGCPTEDVEEPVLRTMQDGAVVLIERNAQAEAAAATVLAELGFFAPPPGSPLDELPGVLQMKDETAWIGFAQHGLPRLHAAGWDIALGDDYRYDLFEVDEWYAELDEDGSDWFSLELGIVVDGERHPLLPLLVQMVRAAPHDFSPSALAARTDDESLLVELSPMERVALPWVRIKPILSTLGELYFGERLGRAVRLPPKTEIVLPIELGSVQRDLYETVRVAMDQKVQDEIDRKGLARSQIVILDALLKLRQVCCAPRLLKTDTGTPSAKLHTLMELLDTLGSEGRKVLVFSQFTSMLALIGEELRTRGTAYVELTGATVDRAAPVAAFQAGQVGVFLISLKAGGVGLNLTAADTVIHYDPWWNPAAENQATDRAWRIGQQQPVFVYKLIARGTLEEKIQDMQRRKGELANALLANETETELAPSIGADDLRAIFAPP